MPDVLARTPLIANAIEVIRAARVRALGTVVCALAVAGCAGGTVTETAELKTGANPAPSYALSEVERRATCIELEVTIKGQAPKLKALEAAAEAERQAAAPTLIRALSRAFGPPGSDSKALDDLERERALTNAYGEAYRDKGCGTIETRALTKSKDAATATGGPGTTGTGGTRLSSSPPQQAPELPDSDIKDLEQVALPRGY